MQIVKNCRELKMFLHKNKLTVLKIQTTEECAPPVIHLQNISKAGLSLGGKLGARNSICTFQVGGRNPVP